MRPTHALSALLAAAISAVPQQTTPPTLQVYSRETIVDVTVTDSKGNPVHGLKQSDFTLEEDNNPQSIRSFVEAAGRSAAAVPTPPPKLPPNVYTNRPAAPAQSGAALNLILLDALNVPPSLQVIARQEAIRYAHGMAPGTQVALLALDNGLRVLQEFTSDPEVLIAAINNPSNSFLRPSSLATDSCAPDLANRMTLESLREIAAFVAGDKGRKNLIWFTTGIRTIIFKPAPMLPIPACLPDYEPDLHRTYNMLAAAQIAVNMVDLAGVVQVRGGADPHVFNTQSMEAVAEATGGHAYYNTNDLAGAVSKVVESGASYYTLSYVPPGREFDGKFHSFHVAVNRPGLHLVYRNGYYAEDPSKIAHLPVPTLAALTPDPQANTMAASMARFAPTATQLLFDVQLLEVKAEPSTTRPAPPNPPNPPNPKAPPILGALDPKLLAQLKGKPLIRYSLAYTVPTRQIAFSDGDDFTHNGALEFDIVAYDAQARLVTSLGQTVKVPLSEEAYQQFIDGPATFSEQIDLPPGPLTLRIGIRDAVSNKIGTLEISLTVPKK